MCFISCFSTNAVCHFHMLMLTPFPHTRRKLSVLFVSYDTDGHEATVERTASAARITAVIAGTTAVLRISATGSSARTTSPCLSEKRPVC